MAALFIHELELSILATLPLIMRRGISLSLGQDVLLTPKMPRNGAWDMEGCIA